jgi:hypothetical protein
LSFGLEATTQAGLSPVGMARLLQLLILFLQSKTALESGVSSIADVEEEVLDLH